MLAPGTILGGCRIEAVIGRGGMGVVYRARQLDLDRDVAVKVIAPELVEDAQTRTRFLTEARAAGAIEHPNVVPVHGVGVAEGRAYLVMRYVAGDDLRTLVRRDGPLSPRQAAAVAEQLGDALDAIHAAGYVHRDVKPQNVMIGADGHVYLSDFGLAKEALATSGPTTAEHWVGTLDYVAPEQIRGERVDARADVYALGGVLCFMLSGRVPFERPTDEAKLWAHVHDAPPVLSELRPGLPPALDAVVARALAKDPAARQAAAGDLGRAARDAAEGRMPHSTVTTRLPPSATRRATARAMAGTRRARPGRGGGRAGVRAAGRRRRARAGAGRPRRGDRDARRERRRPRVSAPFPGRHPPARRRRGGRRRVGAQHPRGARDPARHGDGRADGPAAGHRHRRDEPRGRRRHGLGRQGARRSAVLGLRRAHGRRVAAAHHRRRCRRCASPPAAAGCGSSGAPAARTSRPRSTATTATAPAPRCAEEFAGRHPGDPLGGGAAWVALGDRGSCASRRPAPDDGRRSRSRPAALAYGAGRVWATIPTDDHVERIDPATGETRQIAAGRSPAGIALAGGRVYVASEHAHRVVVFDPRAATAATCGPIRVAPNPYAVAAGAGHVWVTGLGTTPSRGSTPERP